MDIKHVTFHNGLSILLCPIQQQESMLYGYYLLNGYWMPTVLDVHTINTIKDTVSDYNHYISHMIPEALKQANTPPSSFIDIPGTYRFSRAGGSELFTNNPTGFEPMQPQLLGGSGSPSDTKGNNFGTVVAPVFPKVEPNWYYTGFPAKVAVGGSQGNLIDYIPIYFYATRDGNEKFTLPKLPDRLGYLDTNNTFTETLVWDGSFKKDQLLFVVLLDKKDPACAGSKVNNNSYWGLMTEFSNIDPGSTASKTITITSGVSKEKSFTFSTSIGMKITAKAGIPGIVELSQEFSASLSTSFGSKIDVSSQVTTSDTVNFQAQDKTQRIATFQFFEQYNINAAKPLQDKVKDYNNKSKNYVANFAHLKFN